MRLAEAFLAGAGLLSFAQAARAGVVVQDCAPATVVSAATGERRAMLERARTFHDFAPDYQQDQCMDFQTGAVAPRNGACEAPTWWRTDCSGFVSSVWSLSESLDTAAFGHGGKSAGQTWTEKNWDSLEPGDAVNLPGDHIALFTGWLDAAHSSFCVLEEIHVAYTDAWGGLGCIADARVTTISQAQGFVPIGLTGIEDGSADGGPIAGGDAASSDGTGMTDADAIDSGMAFAGPRRPGQALASSEGSAATSWLALPLVGVLALGVRRGRPRET